MEQYSNPAQPAWCTLDLLHGAVALLGPGGKVRVREGEGGAQKGGKRQCHHCVQIAQLHLLVVLCPTDRQTDKHTLSHTRTRTSLAFKQWPGTGKTANF